MYMLMYDLGYARVCGIPKIMGTVNEVCAVAGPCMCVCAWHVIMKYAYPVMFRMVHAVCAGVFREVP